MEATPNRDGFTVVRGERPDRFSGRSTIGTILERLRVHPQARRLLTHKQVHYLASRDAWGPRLRGRNCKPERRF